MTQTEQIAEWERKNPEPSRSDPAAWYTWRGRRLREAIQPL